MSNCIEKKKSQTWEKKRWQIRRASPEYYVVQYHDIFIEWYHDIIILGKLRRFRHDADRQKLKMGTGIRENDATQKINIKMTWNSVCSLDRDYIHRDRRKRHVKLCRHGRLFKGRRPIVVQYQIKWHLTAQQAFIYVWPLVVTKDCALLCAGELDPCVVLGVSYCYAKPHKNVILCGMEDLRENFRWRYCHFHARTSNICVISMLIIGHEEKDIQRAEPKHKGGEDTQIFKALFLYVYFLLLRAVKYRCHT